MEVCTGREPYWDIDGDRIRNHDGCAHTGSCPACDALDRAEAMTTERDAARDRVEELERQVADLQARLDEAEAAS